MTDSAAKKAQNEELKNFGIKDVPRILKEKLFEQSGAIMFPSQITPSVVEKAKKTQEELFVGKTEEDKQFFRAVGAGIFDIPNEIKHISDWAQGNPYDPNELIDLKVLGLEKEGDKDDAFYQITKFSSGFLIPYLGFSKALGKINGIKALGLEGVKHIDKVATGARWFTAGGAADFVAIDAYDENLFNFLAGIKNPIVNNSFVKPIFEYLEAPEKPEEGDPDNYGEAKLKQFFAGTVFGEAVGLTATGAIKAAPILKKGIAEKSVDVVDAITGGPKILDQKQVLNRTMRLLKDIKKDPKRRNFFLQQKKKIDNATLVGSEEFSDEFTDVLDSIPDLNTTITDEVPSKTTGRQKILPGTPHPTDAKKVRGYDGRWVTKKHFEKVTESRKGADKIKAKFDQPQDQTFEDWVKNPPEEYKALFKEIEETSKSANETIARSKQLFKEIQSGLDEQDRLLKEGSQYDQLSPTDQKKVDLEVSLRGDAGGGGAVPPRKPPSGSSGADVPPSPDSDGFKLLETKPNPNVWGPDEDVLRITEDMWNTTAKAVNRISIPDDFTVEAATAMGYGDLLPKVKQISKLLSPKDPEKHLRVVYLGAIKEQKKLAKAVSSSMADIEQAFLLGETVPDELLTQWSEDVINMIQLTAPTKTISSEVAGTLRVNQLIDAEPKHVATTTVDEDVAKGLSGGESVAERAKKDKYQPTTSDLVKKAKKEITEKKAVPTKEELLEGLKSYIDSNDVEGLLGITRKVLAMQGDSKRLSKLTQGLGFSGRADRGMRITNEIFINSLLTAPETHIVNIVGSLMNVALGPLDLAAGSPILDKESKARAARELVKIFTSTGDNFKAAGKALWLDKNILDERRMFGQDAAERYALRMAGDNYLAKTINLVGHGFRIPGRFMMAGDEFVKQAAFRSHLWGEFTEQATKQGLTGQSWKIYVNSNFDEVMDIVNTRSIREGTEENILDAYTRALDYAADRTFTDELGKGFFMNGVGSEQTKKLASILKSTPLKPVVPFVTTPINIGKHVLRRTGIPDLRTLTKGMPPKYQASLGRILKEHNDRLMSEDLATAYRANGEATVGGAIWAYFIALAAAKDDPEAELALVGGGHHNKWIRQNEQRSEELPYSFRTVVKDKNGKVIRGADGLPKYEYLDFLSRMEPVASLLMIAGDMAYCRDFADDEDYDNAAQCQIALLSRNLNNKYMIQNIAQLFDLTSDTNALQRFLRIPANYVSSIVNYPASLKRSIVRAKGETWFDELTQQEYKGRFPKRKVKMRKGDIKPQEIRTEDVGQYSEDEFPFEGNDLGSLKNSNNPFQLLDTFGLMLMRNLQDGTSGFSADIEPIRSMTTGEIATYPDGAFYGDYFNPFKYRKSKNNPIDSYIRRVGVKLIEPSDVIPFDSLGNGINLTTPEYNKMRNLIPFLPLNIHTGEFDPKNGIRFGTAILELAKNKENLKALEIIESDTSGSIDAQATLKRKTFFKMKLQEEIRSLFGKYKAAAVEYYIENLLDPEKKKAAINEVRRSNKDANDIMNLLEQ